MSIDEILSTISKLHDCTVMPPAGCPIADERHELPKDLSEFYELCGGVELYTNSDYPIRIVSSDEVVKANPVIIGEIPDIPYNGIPADDISESWYIIADDYDGDYLTIDLGVQRQGQCYDSHHELHPGNSPVIALSFRDLLVRLISNEGRHWYWLQKEFDLVRHS